jgi:Zn-dependent M28 family amino/carboxypeptidase
LQQPKQLREAAEYITMQFKDAGYPVECEEYTTLEITSCNVVATKRGRDATHPIVIIGAHYDTLDYKSHETPGADDNASGVAVMLELARRMAPMSTEATVRFIAFTNEEPPYFHTEAMGSRVYARAAKQRGEQIKLMLSLDAVGYYSSQWGSQRYPPILGPFYPNRGDFLGVITGYKWQSLLKPVVHAFRRGTNLPVEMIATPQFIEGTDFSDHWSFWVEGYPAALVTDTAFYRNPHYHQPTDTWDTLDYERLAAVVDGLTSVVLAFAKPSKNSPGPQF